MAAIRALARIVKSFFIKVNSISFYKFLSKFFKYSASPVGKTDLPSALKILTLL